MPFISFARLIANRRTTDRLRASNRRLRRVLRRRREFLRGVESHRDYLLQRLSTVSHELHDVRDDLSDSERLRNEAVDLLQSASATIANEYAGRLQAEHLLEVEYTRRTIGWYAQ